MTTHVIGCGVIGLTTAVRLQEEGFRVRIFTKALPQHTVSAVAAAIWMPFKVEPLEAVNRWSRVSFKKFEQLAENSSSGVKMVDFLTLFPHDNPPVWLSAMPEGTFRKAHQQELPAGYHYGWMVRVPMIETPVYLHFLLEKFRSNGGEIDLEEVDKLEARLAGADFLINCTGLAAGKLANDPAVYPIRGQIVMVENLPCFYPVADEEGPNALAYILPRKDCTILGGTADTGNSNEQPDEEITHQIRRRCIHLIPGLDKAKVLKSVAGLRPGRSAIRLEREPSTQIVHNYGHGGGGYTVSWGCAEDVVNIIAREVAK